jgi:hypothetical protein
MQHNSYQFISKYLYPSDFNNGRLMKVLAIVKVFLKACNTDIDEET